MLPNAEIGVALMVQFLTISVLAGLFWRRRYATSLALVLYLLVVLATDVLVTFGPRKLDSEDVLYALLGPHGFYTKTFWLGKELTLNLLKFLVALELAYRTFRAFPGARSTARRVMLLLAIATLVSVLAVTPQVSATEASVVNQMIGRLQPRVLNGTVWLLTGIAAVVLWYRLPIDRFHKAVLTAFVPYLLVFTILLNMIDAHNWDDAVREQASAATTVAYLLLLAYWTRAAWAPKVSPSRAPMPVSVLERPVA
jgi:hypothetical protein